MPSRYGLSISNRNLHVHVYGGLTPSINPHSRPLLCCSQDIQSTVYPIQCPVRRAKISYSAAGHIQCPVRRAKISYSTAGHIQCPVRRAKISYSTAGHMLCEPCTCTCTCKIAQLHACVEHMWLRTSLVLNYTLSSSLSLALSGHLQA